MRGATVQSEGCSTTQPMQRQSGSVLPKITFVLVLFIAAAAGYLVVRERLRADAERRRAEAASNVIERDAKIAEAIARYTNQFAATNKVTYAPLRNRVVTNTVPVPSNRFVRLTNVPSAPPVVLVGDPRDNPRNTTTLVPSESAPLVVAGSGRPVPGGAVTGRVFLLGTPPPEKAVTLDAACGRLHPAPMTTRHYVVGAGGTLADVFIYVKQGAPPRPAVPTTEPPFPFLDQVNCEYVPYVLGVQVGQVLKVRNSDPLLHNVHLVSKAGNKERNVGQPVRGMVTDFVFEKPEIFVQFKCDVHPWMFAYIGVVEHPWFAVTDGNGMFTLPPGLPAGRYTLAAVHRKLGEQTQVITVGSNRSGPVNFTMEVPAP
jgi:hypothetical protein